MNMLFLLVVLALGLVIFLLRNRRDPVSMRWRSRLIKVLVIVWLAVLAYQLY
jgi:hypothetical protein